MSRNLARASCPYCDGRVVLEEEPRPVRHEEAGVYFMEYRDVLVVANAHCEDCEAQYLAWVEHRGSAGHLAWPMEPGQTHRDLSFRSTFNDEPGDADLPKHIVLRVPVRVGPWPPGKWNLTDDELKAAQEAAQAKARYR